MLDLVQTGSEVTGAYTGSSQGQVTGRIAGNVLTGHWVGGVPGDGGGFELNISADGKTFSGTWGRGHSRNDGGPWIGKRQ